ncbi:MAG: right-handed parallel beta-helix repeat-containing protein, partial [Calditrichota bacterium]
NTTVFENGNVGVRLNNTTSADLRNNVIRENGVDNDATGGIGLIGVSNSNIQENEIVLNGGYGIDFLTTSSSNVTIQSNLIKENGGSGGTEDAGIGLRLGSNNTITQNTITQNSGDGIVIFSGNTGNLITQNEIYDNDELGIDLNAGSNTQGDGVTLNDNADGDSGGNTLLNFPILEEAILDSDNNLLILRGFARPASLMEIFIAETDPTSFGEGRTYVTSLTEGGGSDTDATTDTYGPAAINGILQGTDNTNRYEFSIAVPAGISIGTILTATATDGSNNTSEFSGVVTVAPLGVDVSGTVYRDENHNSTLDGGEDGTGLTLFAKIINSATSSGPAEEAVSVDPLTGEYSFSGVTNDTWIIVIDDNATLADVTPTITTDWIGTEAPSYIRSGIVVTDTDLFNQNFGLFNGSTIEGVVFKDNGITGGTANDGIQNGGETGIPSVTIRATDATGTSIYDGISTDGDGNFSIWIPSSADGTTVRLVEVNPTGYISTGNQVGNTGGTYDRTTDVLAFTNSTGVSYSGIAFGDVNEHSFAPDNQQHTSPGTIVFYPHTFTASTGGSVSFSVSDVATPSSPAYSTILYLDANCNAVLDVGESIINGSITVEAEEEVCLILKVTVPPGAPDGGSNLS